MKRLMLCLITICSAGNLAATTGEKPDCKVIEYPRLSFTGYVATERAIERRDKELNNANNTDDPNMRDAYISHASNIEYYIPVNALTRAAVRRDVNAYGEALKEISSNGYREGLAISLLEIYFASHELGLPEPSQDLMEPAVLEIRRYSQNDSVNQDFLLKHNVSIALYELSKGNQGPAEKMLERYSDTKGKISALYVHSYLTYQMARATLNRDGLEATIAGFQELEANASLAECNRTLLGMSQFYIANSHLLISEILSRKNENLRESYSLLHKACIEVAKSRANLDALFVPGLWSIAYEKTAEIFGHLAAHDHARNQAARFAALEDEAWILSRLR